ncbi:hypothetical protein BCR44DRAFT_1174623 [Catenaria anguillulae PL171]|uniref:Uncharacterized protein n=1 Tax=Catenaria anguillulae PL171 TaxID=765915 RepID=A0A1Y2I0Q7_9FUNG|nr:hypothetical protein BCR44DRAFT_1174623 [Catenaria anguillulae PL171]
MRPRIGGPSAAAAIAPAISPFSLVDNLGSSHRTPGPAPYYNYMLHDVFLKAALREYTDQRELWAITSTSLGAVLRCLQDFDAVMKDVLLSMAAGNARVGPHVSARLAMAHPAFFMLNEILDGKPLLDGILSVIQGAVPPLWRRSANVFICRSA